MVFFEEVPLAPPDPILGLTIAFQEDPRSSKVNLGAGIYKDENLKTPVMKVVKHVEANLVETEQSKEYLPIDGDKAYVSQIGQLVFGSDFWKSESERICGFQAPGGTGALRVGGAFLKKETEGPLYIPNPSWPNHKGVFTAIGYNVGIYPYYNFDNHCLEFEKMLSFFETLPFRSIILFHASCHNPTGEDLSLSQWETISEVCIKKQFFPFFDCAYQGFGRGIDEDVAPIRLFAGKQIEMAVAVSQSKNFSLYGERVGGLYVLSLNKTVADNVRSSVKQVIRTHYSNPPMHGAKIVGQVLQDEALRKKWLEELEMMRQRINQTRKDLMESLEKRVKGKNLSYMKTGNGMFCFTGLNKSQVETMIRDFGIYMTTDGRINICGLNGGNIEYVAEAISTVMQRGGAG